MDGEPITIEMLYNDFWRDLGATPEFARQCLRARIDTLFDVDPNTNYEPAYFKACENIQHAKIMPTCFGDYLYRNLLDRAKEL